MNDRDAIMGSLNKASDIARRSVEHIGVLRGEINKQASEIAALKAANGEALKKAASAEAATKKIDEVLLKKASEAVFSVLGTPSTSAELIAKVWADNPNRLCDSVIKLASCYGSAVASAKSVGALEPKDEGVVKKASAAPEKVAGYRKAFHDSWNK